MANEGSNRNLYLAAIVACMTGALFGYSVGFIGDILVLPSYITSTSIDLRQIAWPPQPPARVYSAGQYTHRSTLGNASMSSMREKTMPQLLLYAVCLGSYTTDGQYQR